MFRRGAVRTGKFFGRSMFKSGLQMTTRRNFMKQSTARSLVNFNLDATMKRGVFTSAANKMMNQKYQSLMKNQTSNDGGRRIITNGCVSVNISLLDQLLDGEDDEGRGRRR